MKWDLTHIYKDKTLVNKEILGLQKDSCDFLYRYKDCLKLLSINDLKQAIIQYKKLRNRIYKLSVFSFFVFSENKNEIDFYKFIQNHKKNFLQTLFFFEKELINLPTSILQSLEQQNEWLREKIKQKKHMPKDYTFFKVREDISSIYANTINSSKDKEKYTSALKASIKLNSKFASIQNYSSRLSSFNGYNCLSNTVGSRIINEVFETFKDISQPFFLQRSQKYNKKITILNWKTEYSALSSSETLKLVLSSFSKLDQKYAKILKNVFLENRINASLSKNSYSCQVCSDIKPYIFLSLNEKVENIPILAHEFGHYIHQYRHYKKGALYYDPPFVVSEIFSIFSELFVLDNLIKRNTNIQKELLNLKSERLISLIYIQTVLFLFEKEVYEQSEIKEMKTKDFNQIWQKYNYFCLGVSMDRKASADIWMSFYYMLNNPFYSFSYILSCLIALNLLEKYKTDIDFYQKYRLLISNTNYSDTYSLLNRLFGINIREKGFTSNTLKNIKKLC